MKEALMKSFNIIVLFLFCRAVFASEIEDRLKNCFFNPPIESLDIADWEHPTIADYWKIQRFFKQKLTGIIEKPISERPFYTDYLNTEFYGWLTYRMGRLKLIKDEEEMPSFHTVYFNNDPEKKDKCVICYAGYPSPGSEQRNYTLGIDLIIQSLKKHNFDGHFIYRIGGWPNIQKGRLRYADVPFAFKPFLFEEVRDLGYKKILWLDSSCVPVKSLDPVFNWIETYGLCFKESSMRKFRLKS
jgi:hypothetical protein